MRRVYDGNILVDWDVPPDAAVCPPDEDARRKWGWQQDDQGRWYRLLASGQGLQDPPRTRSSIQGNTRRRRQTTH